MDTIPAFYFNHDHLKRLVKTDQANFVNAEPFRHVVIDNFLDEHILQLLIDEFPKPDEIDWTYWGPGRTKQTRDKKIEKIGASDEVLFGPFTRHFMTQLNSATFISFLEELTQVKDIIVDPSYNHCGLHSTGPGGRLMVHTDTNRHPIKGNRIHQHLNLIFFINKNWQEEFGGHLELWNADASRCIKEILPIANRCVIFDTGSKSYHGHPHPLKCPLDRRRNSLAVYYYSLDRPTDANYLGLQNKVNWIATTSEDQQHMDLAYKKRRKEILKKFVPPIFLDIKNALIKRTRM